MTTEPTKQALGKKKHKLCERTSAVAYTFCLTRGGWPHGVAECYRKNGDIDYVNYRHQTWGPGLRFRKGGSSFMCGPYKRGLAFLWNGKLRTEDTFVRLYYDKDMKPTFDFLMFGDPDEENEND